MFSPGTYPENQNMPYNRFMLATFICAALAQGPSAKAIMAEASEKLQRATSVTVTVIDSTAGFPQARRAEYSYRKGGYLRIEDAHITRVSSPKAAWAFSAAEKEFNSLPLSKDSEFLGMLSLGPWVLNLPVLNGPTRAVWHGMPALRIELDGSKKMGKESRVSVYYDPKTHLPLGMFSGLGRNTVEEIFEHMKLNPKLDGRLFQFTPPPGWTQVKV